MKNKNLIRFAQSLVVLPVMTMSLSIGSLGGIHNTEIPQSVLVQKLNIGATETLALNQAVDPVALAQKAKADAIDSYFAERDMPLAGTGMKMVQEADKNDLDWRLLPAIAVQESTGGKHDRNNNPFGWDSCKTGFKSYDEAIETVAKNLGGNNPVTAIHYDNKTTKQILNAYNPPYIAPKYTQQVISIMNTIGDEDITSTLAIANS
jgi:hypothetical protein